MRRYLSIPLPIRIGLLCTVGFALVLLAAPLRAETMPAEPICEDGKLVGIRILVPGPGILTVPLPAN